MITFYLRSFRRRRVNRRRRYRHYCHHCFHRCASLRLKEWSRRGYCAKGYYYKMVCFAKVCYVMGYCYKMVYSAKVCYTKVCYAKVLMRALRMDLFAWDFAVVRAKSLFASLFGYILCCLGGWWEGCSRVFGCFLLFAVVVATKGWWFVWWWLADWGLLSAWWLAFDGCCCRLRLFLWWWLMHCYLSLMWCWVRLDDLRLLPSFLIRRLW